MQRKVLIALVIVRRLPLFAELCSPAAAVAVSI